MTNTEFLQTVLDDKKQGEIKMNIEFNEVDANKYDVLVNEDDYGTLKFDEDQGAWVLWPNSIDDAVTYFEDLEETQETITDEIKDFLAIKTF